MAAATAKPPQNIAALNTPKAEWKTVWIIAKWHATGAGIQVLGHSRNIRLRRVVVRFAQLPILDKLRLYSQVVTNARDAE